MGYIQKTIVLSSKPHKLGRSLDKILRTHKSYIKDYYLVERITTQIYINDLHTSYMKICYHGQTPYEINDLYIYVSKNRNLNDFKKIVNNFINYLVYSALFRGISLLVKEGPILFDPLVLKGCLTEKGRTSIGLPKDHLRW